MGDLSIYDLDGSQIALRRETASRIRVRSDFATGVEHAKRD